MCVYTYVCLCVYVFVCLEESEGVEGLAGYVTGTVCVHMWVVDLISGGECVLLCVRELKPGGDI